MTFRDKLKRKEGVERKDILGGGGVVETDIYTMTIRMAYLGESKGGATSVTLVGPLDETGREFRQTLWVTSGEDKGCSNTYVDKNTEEERYLPGFEVMDDIALLVTGEELSELDPETITVELWSKEAEAKVPTDVEAFTALADGKVKLAIQKIRKNKQVKNEATGKWEDGKDERFENDIVKAFHVDELLTVNEAENEKEASFHDDWLDANKGKTRDTYKAPEGKGKGKGRADKPKESKPKRKMSFGSKK